MKVEETVREEQTPVQIFWPFLWPVTTLRGTYSCEQTKFIHFSYSVVDPQFQFIDTKIWRPSSILYNGNWSYCLLSSTYTAAGSYVHLRCNLSPVGNQCCQWTVIISAADGVPSQIRINVLFSNSLLIKVIFLKQFQLQETFILAVVMIRLITIWSGEVLWMPQTGFVANEGCTVLKITSANLV